MKKHERITCVTLTSFLKNNDKKIYFYINNRIDDNN